MLFSLLLVDTANLLKSLEIMWKGLVAIFIVIALVIIITVLVNKACVKFDSKKQEKNNLNASKNDANKT